MKRLVAGSFGILALLASVIAVAPASHAGVTPSLILVVQSNQCRPSATSVTGNPGSTFAILVGSGCSVRGDASTGGAPISPTTFTASAGRAELTLGPSGSGTFLLDSSGPGYSSQATITVTITTDPVPEAEPHDDLQQVGVPPSGDCADVSPDVGHYRGYPLGGWSKSWAYWINDGRGGPVCTREVETTASGEVVLIG